MALSQRFCAVLRSNDHILRKHLSGEKQKQKPVQICAHPEAGNAEAQGWVSVGAKGRPSENQERLPEVGSSLTVLPVMETAEHA